MLGKPGHLEYGVDPEALYDSEVRQLIALKRRNAACVYLGLPLDCDDEILEEAEKNIIAWIDTQYLLFKANHGAKEALHNSGDIVNGKLAQRV